MVKALLNRTTKSACEMVFRLRSTSGRYALIKRTAISVPAMIVQIYETSTHEEARAVGEIRVGHIGVLVGDGSFPREQSIDEARTLVSWRDPVESTERCDGHRDPATRCLTKRLHGRSGLGL